ncbi:MAG: hypothetical protein KME16_19110 [Scytolyngbya sp. HA4215-MV1]|jgi:hypothetical protein|nr:hypothetical protein [Scytolyngbya sp. HA4215-MV1]
MKTTSRNSFHLTRAPFWKKATIAVLTSTLLLSGAPAQMVSAAPLLISERQQDWNCALKVARLLNEEKLIMQLDVLNKPQTKYANVVYQIFVRQENRWVEVFTNRGARLVANSTSRMILAPEVIDLKEVQKNIKKELGKEVDWSTVELRTVAQIRYDVQGGRRDQTVAFEQVQFYREIAQTSTTQIISSTSSSAQEVGYEQESQQGREGTNRERHNQQGNFSLAILQKQQTLSSVIARVSVQTKQKSGLTAERFVGDFKYKINQRAKFVKGLKAGDRAIVRLFTSEGRLIGYSAFELLSSKSAVTLILSDRLESGILRTVYGLDTNQDDLIDSSTQVYDYFTQVTTVSRERYSDARVVFFKNVESLNLSAFNLSGLPAPRSTCAYTRSFEQGSFRLISRTIRVFSSGLASAITAAPGQLVQIISLSSTTISIYEVSQLIVTYRSVGVSQGILTSTCDLGCYGSGDDDENEDEHHHRRNCNQGIGNGSEGCDPGNSHPHGGSNDEGGRRPGHKK